MLSDFLLTIYYLYYETFEEFCGHLQIMDIRECLRDEKFVFIFSEKQLEAYYPLDFKKLYGIDHGNMEPQMIRVEEIKRLCICSHFSVASGITFVREIIDSHPFFLVLHFHIGYIFPFLYKVLFKDKEIIELKLLLKNDKKYCEVKEKCYALIPKSVQIQFESFFQDDKKYKILDRTFNLLEEYKSPSKGDWLKAFYLSYVQIIYPKHCVMRIAPIIYFYPHWIMPVVKKSFTETVISYLKDTKHSFEYIKFILLIRDQNTNMGSDFDCHVKGSWRGNSIVYTGAWLMHRTQVLKTLKEVNDICTESIGSGNQWMKDVCMLRFEDLKLEPKATTMALCEFLDIPWLEILLECTQNSRKIYGEDHGFDPAPVYKKREEILNGFDYFRFELLSCGIYKNWGYKYKYYSATTYTKEEIMKMFEIPFKLEILEKEVEGYNPEIARKYREQFMEKVRQWLDKHWEEYQKQEFIVPIPWLKPSEKYIKGDLFQ